MLCDPFVWDLVGEERSDRVWKSLHWWCCYSCCGELRLCCQLVVVAVVGGDVLAVVVELPHEVVVEMHNMYPTMRIEFVVDKLHIAGRGYWLALFAKVRNFFETNSSFESVPQFDAVHPTLLSTFHIPPFVFDNVHFLKQWSLWGRYGWRSFERC